MADVAALRQRQWDIERNFHAEILRMPKHSPERHQAYRVAYEAVNDIHDQLGGLGSDHGREFMARIYRYTAAMLLQLLQRRPGRPVLFEIGFGFGDVLEAVARAGYAVAGIEVDGILADKLAARLPGQLIRGDLMTHQFTAQDRYDVVYWSDVFEHIPPDEALDYLKRIYGLLAPGGVLVTITPNWHARPGDVTRLFKRGRIEAEGFHLKEYTLREMIHSYYSAGFRRVTMPLARTLRRRPVLVGDGLIDIKAMLEPMLEYLPRSVTRALCGVLGLSHTFAWKA